MSCRFYLKAVDTIIKRQQHHIIISLFAKLCWLWLISVSMMRLTTIFALHKEYSIMYHGWLILINEYETFSSDENDDNTERFRKHSNNLCNRLIRYTSILHWDGDLIMSVCVWVCVCVFVLCVWVCLVMG